MAPYKKPASAGRGFTVLLFTGALAITTLLAAMYLTKRSALLLASTPLLAPAAGKLDVGWHAPSKTRVNDLDSALVSDGVYGFIFNSSETPDEAYGTYNYCNMPHARETEYVRPSSEYELQYVELIHRHHKRTPYASNGFPVEPYPWDCDDQGLYYYGEPLSGRDPAQTYWRGYSSDVNPFKPSGWTGTCQFPQITAEGLNDSWVHGRDLYGVYHELLGFLPGRDEEWEDKVRYRVTNNQITSQVAGMVVNGMWGVTDRFPLSIQAKDIDSLEPQYSCPAGSNIFNTIKSDSNPPWKSHLERSSGLVEKLDAISGVTDSGSDSAFHTSFDPYFDNLSSRQCHAKPLPCSPDNTTCVTQSQADAVYRLGHWEYAEMYRGSEDSLDASVAAYGVWVAELAANLRGAMAGESPVIYTHNVAHDGSVSRLLSILQLDDMVWPGMGAEVVFELYKKKGGESAPSESEDSEAEEEEEEEEEEGGGSEGGFYVRVLFNGQPLKSSSPTLGFMEMVPVETLLGYFDGLVGKNASLVKGLCEEE